MARPLSEEKRNAILMAAAEAVASLGLGAPTAKIAQAAGIAEGTLFSYFETKELLLNQLFLEIKQEVVAAVLVDYHPGDELEDRWRVLWGHFIDWGAANPAKHKTMRQLAVSDKISDATKELAMKFARHFPALLEESLKSGVIREQSPQFLKSTMEALADMTLEFIVREPKRHEFYKRAGFETLWNAISNRDDSTQQRVVPRKTKASKS